MAGVDVIKLGRKKKLAFRGVPNLATKLKYEIQKSEYDVHYCKLNKKE